MTEQEIYDGVIVKGTTDFLFVVETLRRHGARWCVIGGLAVNSYVIPVYIANLDLAVAATGLEPVLADLRAADFRIKAFPALTIAQRRVNPAAPSSHKLTVRFVQSGRYQPFLDRTAFRTVLGLDVPVAALTDLVTSELSTWQNSECRASEHYQAKMNLLRLAERHFAEVTPLFPAELRAEAEAALLYVADGWGGDEGDML